MKLNGYIEILLSLIVTSLTYGFAHLIFVADIFGLGITLPVYTVLAIAFLFGLITYLYFSMAAANAILTRLGKAEERLAKMNVKELLMTVAGLGIGLILANLIGSAFRNMGVLGTVITVLLNVIFGFLGMRVARRKKDEVHVPNLNEVLAKTKETEETYSIGRPKILDTSVIIDGRILDLLQTGFIEGILIIPEFVLDELRHIADSADGLKRNRGRRGLDILNEIQKQLAVPVEIRSFTPEKPMEVDAMLLKMAEELDAFVVTNDYNLNKVAEFQGVRVLNINELANAIKPVVLPGEEMQVTIIKSGKEAGQGVAYLNDGTMIVVDGGNRFIGETMQVTVTSVLQTAAGRMIFAKMDK